MENSAPENIAIIMDGNGRWAQSRHLPISAGHKAGCDNLTEIAKYCSKIGVKSLTVYALSTENLKRPKDEVDYLMELTKKYLAGEIKQFMEYNAKVKIIGNFDRLDKEVVKSIEKVEKETENNTGLRFDVAFCYGGRMEIVDSCKKIVKAISEGKIDVDEINEENFRNFLYDSEIKDPDLIIRTGGDYRMSNFLLWEMSYSELYFTKTLWPDFDKNHLDIAIKDFKERRRTFGERKAKR